MSKINDGGPAFPLNYGQDDMGMPNCSEGMSKRDFFAAHAPECPDWFVPDGVEWIDWTEKYKDFKGADRIAEHDRVTENNQKYDRERYFQWPWYYADQMLAREKGALKRVSEPVSLPLFPEGGAKC